MVKNLLILSPLTISICGGYMTSLSICKTSHDGGGGGWFTSEISDEPQTNDRSVGWYVNKISLLSARKITVGRSEVSVGHIDTGIDNYHDLLQDNCDTLQSISFSENSGDFYHNSPFVHGTANQIRHGTLTSSIVCSALDSNGEYVRGITSNIKLISVRADGPVVDNEFDEAGHETFTSIKNSVNYISQNNISLANYSGGFDGQNDSQMQTAFNNYTGLMIVAAGNYHDENHNGWDLDETTDHKVYPACYTNSNIISVGSSNSNDEKALDSNYGATSVDLFAPGVGIECSNFNNSTYTANGTSLAAPMVTGVAAMIKSVNPTLTPLQIKDLILNNVDIKPAFVGRCVSGGRLNAFKAVRAAIPAYTTLGSEMQSLYVLKPGQTHWYKFNAQANTTYTFRGAGSLATRAYLYEYINQDPVYIGQPGASAQHFCFNYTFSTNKTVYICLENVNTSTDSAYLKITSSHTHDYTYSYIYKNSTYHYSYCSCGQRILSPHALSTESNGYCLSCGAYIGGSVGPYLANSNLEPFGNGSYIREDGIIVLAYEDIVPFMNGELEIPCDDEECECHE